MNRSKFYIILTWKFSIFVCLLFDNNSIVLYMILNINTVTHQHMIRVNRVLQEGVQKESFCTCGELVLELVFFCMGFCLILK